MAALVAAFAAGLLGSVHCVGMCGGIAGALSASARGSSRRRIVAFNLGRLGTYAIVGAVAGGFGSLAVAIVPLHEARSVLFVIAQAMLILLGLYIAGWSGIFPRLETAGRGLWRRIEPLRRRLAPIDNDLKALGAGAVWGWVPCGLVYAMLPLAATSGNAAEGALILAAFGAGTLPALVAVGGAGLGVARLREKAWVRRVAGTAIIGLAVFGLTQLPAATDLAALAWLCLSPPV